MISEKILTKTHELIFDKEGQVIYKITQNSHLKKKPVSVSIIRRDVK